MDEPRAEPLNIWTIYYNPSDMPGYFVLRRHVVLDGATGPSPEAYWSEFIEPLRDEMRKRHLHCMPRQDGDEPHIVESWI